MKHIRTFESYRIRKNREEIIKESVLQVNDIYKVKTMIDIPQSLINAYVKKVKDTTGKNLRQFFGDVDIAEEIVKYINLNNLDVEKLPGNALMGGAQGQGQSTQVQTDATQETTEETPTAQEAPAAQAQTPAAQEAPAAQVPAAQAQTPAAQEAPAAQAQTPAAQEAPAAQAQTPTAQEAPAAQAQTPAAQEAPEEFEEPTAQEETEEGEEELPA